MSTNDIYTNIYPKKLMDQQSMADHLLDYLHKLIRDSQSTIYASSGFFSPVTLSADTIDSFDVTAFRGQDDVSDILEWLASNNVPFENANGIPYYVAAGYVEVPNAAEVNPRTGAVEFRNIREEVGDSADPDSVVDNGGGTFTAIVDTLLEAGVDHGGRTVQVWLKDPVSAVDWIEELTVVWDSSNNKITSTGALGQTIISTTAAEYTVRLKGVTVKRNTDLSAVPAYAYIGTVTGAGTGVTPTVFSMAGQILLATDPNVALNLATIYKDVYKNPVFPDDGLPKFSNPIEYWWEQEHNNSDYTHDDVTFKTLVSKILAGVQITLEAFDVGDEAANKFVMKDAGSAVVAFLTGGGEFRAKELYGVSELRALADTWLGSSASDDLSILASIIADVVLDDGTAISPSLDFRASGSTITSIFMDRSGDNVRLRRNDADVAESILQILNAGAGGVFNLEVQGDIKAGSGLGQIDRNGNVVIGDGTAIPSPLLKFSQSGGHADWEIGGNAEVLEVSKSSSADVIFEIFNPGSGIGIVQADKLVTASVIEALGTLAFNDVNLPSAMALSSATDNALATTKQNIIGAINEVFTQPMAHVNLSDMPSAVVSDHDLRYRTIAQLANISNPAEGTNFLGHANTLSGWESVVVKDCIDDIAVMLDSQDKGPTTIFWDGSNVVVPAQVVNCLGKIRYNAVNYQLTWGDVDSGVTQQNHHAYYVYLKPDASPAKTYTPIISDTTPVYGFCPTGGKVDWIYVGAFITQDTGDVCPFTKVGNVVMLQSGITEDKYLGNWVNQSDLLIQLTDGANGVIPETARMIVINVACSIESSASIERTVALAKSTPAATNYELLVGVGILTTGGIWQKDRNGAQGIVSVTATRGFYMTSGCPVALERMGWLEDNQDGTQ